MSAKMEIKQQTAELAVRAETMKKRRQLAQQRLELQLQQEELDLEEEMAVSAAKGKALDDLVENDNKSVSGKSVSIKSVKV